MNDDTKTSRNGSSAPRTTIGSSELKSVLWDAANTLRGSGKDLIFVDKASGAKAYRPGLTHAGLAPGLLGPLNGPLGHAGGGATGAGHRLSVDL